MGERSGAGIAGSVDARGPQLSVDVDAYCGDSVVIDPAAEAAFGYTNVAVVITDTSDDNGPDDAMVGLLEVTCTAAVKTGRSRPDQVEFDYRRVGPLGFGTFDFTCDLDRLADGATERQARATVSGGDLRARSGNCEEVPVT